MLLAVSDSAQPGTSMCWRRGFPGRADQVRVVRAFARHLLADFPALDDVLLVLDELAVNAIRHTRSGLDGGRFAVEIRTDPGALVVHVADEGGPMEPCRHEVADLVESGRGLLTVEALAASWSWAGGAQGRTVRATFRLVGGLGRPRP